MADDRILEEAISAIQNGQKGRARDLITRLLRKDPARVDYWLYMSAVVETPKERIFCLENVLKYDPGNETAANGLVMLGAMQPSREKPPVRPVNERTWDITEMFSGDSVAKPAAQERTRMPLAQTMTLILVAVVSVVLLLVGVIGNPFYVPTPIANAGGPNMGTRAPLITAGPSPTYLPTKTPQGGVPTDNPLKPTALRIVLEETFTPTPRYVDTPHPNVEAYQAGLRSIEAGNYASAIALFDQAKDVVGDTIDIKYYIALARLLNTEYETAKRDFSLIIQADDTFAPAYVGRAMAQLGIKGDSNVAADLYKAVALDPNYIEGYLAIAAFRLRNNEPEEILPIAEKVLELDPANARGFHYLAEAYIGLNEPELALEAAQKSQEYDITNLEHYYTLAHALIVNGREAEAYGAIELYLSDPKNQENIYAWYLLGRAQQGLGDHESALENFAKVYAQRKDIYEMSYYWAVSYIATGEYEKALERVTVPLERIPRWFEPFVAKAQAYYYMNNAADAKETIEEGAEYAKTDAQKAVLYYWRALIYAKLGYPEISDDNWEKLLELPEDVVPRDWRLEAQDEVGLPVPTMTIVAPTPTRVPTNTPKP